MTSWRALPVCLALVALSGCVVGPDYHAPVPPSAAAGPFVTSAPDVDPSTGPDDAWWRLYEAPDLEPLIAEALRANVDLRAAEANLTSGRAVVDAARAGQLPTTGLEAGGIYGRDPVTDEILELGGHAPQTTWLFDDAFSVSYELDLFGRIRRLVEASRADAQATLAARDAVRVSVVSEVARDYVEICTLGEEFDVARHSVDVAAREVQITTDRHEAGANSRFDVVRTEAVEAQARAALPELDGRRRAALFELAALLGRAPANAPAALLACHAAPRLAGKIAIGDGAALLKRRPDVRAVERRLAAATARIGVATADLYPRIELGGFYGGAATDIPALVTSGGLAWGVGPSIRWAFPNQAEPRARIKAAKAGEAAALARFDGAVLQALKETEQALALYGADQRRRDALRIARSKSEEAYRLARESLAAGKVSSLDLLTTEEALIQADAAMSRADAAVAGDEVSLFRALGGGWRSGGGA